MGVNTDDAPPAAAPPPAALPSGVATPTPAIAATPTRAASPPLDRATAPTTADAHATALEPAPTLPEVAATTTTGPSAADASAAPLPAAAAAAAPSAPGDAQQQQTPALPPRPEEDQDPNIGILHGMFPDFDLLILQSVLESVNGDQDRAIDVLLGMNDPSYVSQDTGPHPSQTDLDEELARRLTIEEERREAERIQQGEYAAQQRANQPSWVPQAPAQGAVWGGQPGGPPQSPPPGQRDAMSEISEQLGKFAETGKKTFSSLFAKVKQKVQDFETQQTTGFNKPQYGWDASQAQVVAPGQQQPTAQPTTQQPVPQAAPRPSASYFDTPGPSGTTHQGSTPLFPAVQSAAPSGPAGGPAAQLHPTVGAPTTAQTQGVGAGFTAGDVSVPAAHTSHEAGFGALAAAADALGRPSVDSSTPRPPTTSTGPPTPGGIDPGRIGLLPKRPVSLLRDSTTSTPASAGQPANKVPVASANNSGGGDGSSNAAAPQQPVRKATSDSDDMYV